MKKRSDKFTALLLCAFMAFSLIAAAADVPAEACAECGLTEGHSDTCSQYVAPADPETCAECGYTDGHSDTCSQYVAPVDPETCAECGCTEGHSDTCSQYVAPVDPETCAECGAAEGHSDTCSQYVAPVDPAPSTDPEPTPEPTPAPQDPVELKTLSLNGDAAGMNFTVSGELPENSKLQVKAIDVSCNDYIVGNYLSDVELPQGVAMAFELSILVVEEQDGVEQKTPYMPTAANKLTVSVSGSKEDCFSALAAYHLPGATAKQVETVVKALAEGEVSAEELPAAQPAALDADGNPLRYYNPMNVESYGEGKKIFTFKADGLSVFFLVAEVGSDHVDGCAGEDCTDASCPCQCHSLYARLMACTTLEEFYAQVDAATEEELSALTENQKRQVEAKIAELEPEPLPPVVLETSEEPVAGEIVYPTKNFAWVAPFGSPVVG